MKIKILSGLLFLFITISFSRAQESSKNEFSLQEAIDYAIEESRVLKEVRLDIQGADAQILNYWSTGIPQLNGNVRYIHNIKLPQQWVPAQFVDPMAPEGTYAPLEFGTKNQLTAGVDLQALIFSGSFTVGLKAQKLYKELTQKNLDAAEVKVIEQVTKAYYNVLITQENLDILKTNKDIVSSSYEDIKMTYDAGFAEKIDVNRLELAEKNLENQIKNVQATIDLAKNVLKFQMNFPLTDEIILTNSIEDLSDEAKDASNLIAEEFSPMNRPEYKPLMLAQQMNEVNVKSIKAGYIPTLTAIGNYQQSLSRDNLTESENAPSWVESAYVGLNLGVPIFDGLNKHSRIQQAKVDLAKAELQLFEFKEASIFQAKNAVIEYTNAKNLLNNNKETMKLAEEIYQIDQIKFEEGVGSSVALRQSEQEFYNAQSNYINSLYDLMNAYIDLQVARGTLHKN